MQGRPRSTETSHPGTESKNTTQRKVFKENNQPCYSGDDCGFEINGVLPSFPIKSPSCRQSPKTKAGKTCIIFIFHLSSGITFIFTSDSSGSAAQTLDWSGKLKSNQLSKSNSAEDAELFVIKGNLPFRRIQI